MVLQNVFTIHILFLEHVSGNNISSKEIWYIFAWSSHLVFDSSTWLCHFIYVKDWNFIFLTSCVLLNRITNNLLRIVLLTWMNTLMLQPINLFIVVCKWFPLIKETLIEFHKLNNGWYKLHELCYMSIHPYCHYTFIIHTALPHNALKIQISMVIYLLS